MMKFLGGCCVKAIGTATSIAPTARMQLLKPCAMGFDLIAVAANLTSSIALGNQLCPSVACAIRKCLPRWCDLTRIGIRYLYLDGSRGSVNPVPQIRA